MKYCDKCFVDLEKEEHKDWCPKKEKTMDLPEGFEELFKGFKKDVSS
jgi:hypothetical protein